MAVLSGTGGEQEAAEESDALNKLLQNIVLVISLQVIGYVFTASRIMPPERAPGLGFFVANIALPSLLFRSIATLDVGLIDGALVGGVVVSKLIVFIASVDAGWQHMNAPLAPAC